MTKGTVIGNLAISASGRDLNLVGFDLMKGGDYELTVWVHSTIGGGSSTGSIQAAANGYTIFEDTSMSLAKLSSNTNHAPEMFRDYIPKFSPNYVTQNGYLSLEFQFYTNPGTTSQMYITPPSVAPYTSATIRAFYRCKFIDLADVRDSQYFSEYCKYNFLSKRWEIKMPKSTTLQNSKVYRLDIFRVAQNGIGVKMPTVANDFEFNVKLVNSAGTTKNEFVTSLRVTQALPAMSCFKNFVSNTGLKNVFMMRIEPTNTIPSGSGFVHLHFPTSVMNHNTQ